MRMSGTEALMWSVRDEPLLRPEMVNVAILDRPPDRDRLVATAERALASIPRLSQRVESPPVPVAPPEWVDVDVDVTAHISSARCPAPGDEDALFELVAAVVSDGLDTSRPLWAFTVVEGLADGRAALVQHLHHTVVDGVGGMKLSLSFVDLERDPSEPPPRQRRTGTSDDRHSESEWRLGALARAFGDALEELGTAVRDGIEGAAHLVTHPGEVPATVGRSARVADSLRRQLSSGSGASPLLADRSEGLRLFMRAWPLEAFRRAATDADATVNDVYVAALVSALGLYHERLAAPVDSLSVAMPVSLREHGETGGNRFAPVRLSIPVGAPGAPAHLHAVSDLLHAARSEPSLQATEGFAGFAVLLPSTLLTQLTLAQGRSLDLAASNLRGSPVPLYMAGARIDATVGFGPRTASAVNATTISYCGHMYTGFNVDPAAVTEPRILAECVDEALAATLG